MVSKPQNPEFRNKSENFHPWEMSFAAIVDCTHPMITVAHLEPLAQVS